MINMLQAGVGDIAADWVSLLSEKELNELNRNVRKTHDQVIDAIKVLAEITRDADELKTRSRKLAIRFGPAIATPAAVIAFVPLAQAKKSLDVGIRRISVLYLVFSVLTGTYRSIFTGLKRAGLKNDANVTFQLIQALEKWMADASIGLYTKVPNSLESRREINSIFRNELSRRGLTPFEDNDKPGYYQALEAAVSRYIGKREDVASMLPGSGMAGGPLVLIILGLIKLVLIIGAVITVVALVNSSVQTAFGASDKAMAAALEFEKRKTARQKLVSEGKITQEQANQMNEEEAIQLQAEIEQVSKLKPGLALAGILLPVGIGVGLFAYMQLSKK